MGLGINLLSFGGLAVPSQTVFGSIGILYIYIHISYNIYIYILYHGSHESTTIEYASLHCSHIYTYTLYMYICDCNGETHIQWWLIHGNHDDEAEKELGVVDGGEILHQLGTIGHDETL